MASKSPVQQSSSDDLECSNGSPSKLVMLVHEPVWNPLSSSDWDRESYSIEVIVRIKRCDQ